MILSHIELAIIEFLKEQYPQLNYKIGSPADYYHAEHIMISNNSECNVGIRVRGDRLIVRHQTTAMYNYWFYFNYYDPTSIDRVCEILDKLT